MSAAEDALVDVLEEEPRKSRSASSRTSKKKKKAKTAKTTPTEPAAPTEDATAAAERKRTKKKKKAADGQTDTPAAAADLPEQATANQSAFSKRLQTREADMLSLAWRNVTYWIETSVRTGACAKETTVKRILNSVSGECRAGELLAIMGASGAGKTSLLNVLAGRTTGLARGDVRVNGKRFEMREFRRVSAYVVQEDLLFPNLTVRETLMFVAKLRLPHAGADARAQLVDDIIGELGLVKCADSLVGNALRRGISGGEKKRLSIACELVVDPAIVFLDEPTTGLDSFTALNLVLTLRAIAHAGRTIICTIHQPRSGIFQLFDRLLLLAGEGEVAYYGDAKHAPDYFAQLGHPCPVYTNPADHFLDVTAINTQSIAQIEKTKERVAKITATYKTTNDADHVPPLPDDASDKCEHLPGADSHQMAGFFQQLATLTQRSAYNLYRDKPRTVFRVLQAVIVGAIIGFIFYQRDFSIISIQDRIGVLFFIMINQAFGGMFSSLNVFIDERVIFVKERAARWYNVLPYFFAKTLAELPMSLVPIVFGSITYWIINLNPDPNRFGIFLLAIYLTTFVAESLGLCIAAVAPNGAVANAIAPLILVFFLVFGGFYINAESIPAFFIWLEYWSFVKYGYEALIVNEFEGQTFRGPDPAQDNVIVQREGSQVIKGLGMDASFKQWDLLILLLQGVVYRMLAYVILRAFRKGPRGGTLEPMTSAEEKEVDTKDRERRERETQRRTERAKKTV